MLVTVPQEVLSLLDWLKAPLHMCNRAPASSLVPSMTLVTDMYNSLGSSLRPLSDPVPLPHPPSQEMNLHINTMELRAICLAYIVFLLVLQGAMYQVLTDLATNKKEIFLLPP